jgi:hypothetical protein
MPKTIAEFATPLTPLARRVIGELTALRDTRSRLYGLRADIEALFARLGFDPTNPAASPAAAAVVAAVGLSSADDLPAALTALSELGGLDLSTPLSRVALPS